MTLVYRFMTAFYAADYEQLQQLCAPNILDLQPLPLQPSGLDGVLFKACVFLAEHPSAQSEITLLEASGELMVARWRTHFSPGGLVGEFLGRFWICDGQIAQFEVEHVPTA